MNAPARRSPRLLLLALAAAASLLPGGMAAASPPTARAGAGFRLPPPARTVLKNGLTVLVLERHAIPLIQMHLMIKSGSTDDPAGKEGTAFLVARLLKRGTRTRPAEQLFEEIEFVGGSIDTRAGLDASLVDGEFASRDLEVGFNLFADLALNPAFRQEEIEKERRLALADLADLLDDAERIAGRAFASWLYDNHPYGRPVDGTGRSLEAITRDDLTSFYGARYTPNNAVLAIAGDIDAAQAAQRADRYFSAWKRGAAPVTKLPPAAPVRGRRILLVDKPDATQSQIRLGNVALKRTDPDYFPLLVGNTVLGGGFTSWLVDEVRVKRGLTYGVSSRLQTLRASGSLSVSTFSKNASVLETIRVCLEQLKRLRLGPVPAADLDKARGYLSGLYPLRLESPDDLVAETLGVELDGLGPEFIGQYPARVRAVAPESVARAVGRYVTPDDLALVVVGPAGSLRKDLETLGPVTVRPLAAVAGADSPRD